LEIDFYLMNCNIPDPNTTGTLGTWGNYYKKDTTLTFPNGLAPTIKVAVAHDANTDFGSMASNPDKFILPMFLSMASMERLPRMLSVLRRTRILKRMA
jgi:hypothetical protein